MICKRCVLDSSLADIHFDEYGYCNYCTEYLAKRDRVLKDKGQLNALLRKLRRPDRKTGCVVGLSGGLDSSYLLNKAVEFGLNPVAVHVDTGWNTEVAVGNIKAITQQLNVELRTCVLDWEQFRDLQLSYLRAGVIDMEFPTDHYYLAGLYSMAAKLGINCILTGNNYVSEGIMPACWIHNKGDCANMLDIHRKYGSGTRINRLPTMGLFKKFWYYNVLRIRNIFLLDYLDYDRKTAREELRKKSGWREHPLKHGESVFTRFYHRYILPVKFGVDIRKAHLSSLICSGRMSRNAALQELSENIMDREILRKDKEFVLKKFGIGEGEFDDLMRLPAGNHREFRSETKLKAFYNRLRAVPVFRQLLRISNRT